MLADLRKATQRGARVVVFNTLKEKGLHRFADPQNKLEMIRGGSEATSTDYYRPRLGGDMAIFRGMAKVVFAADEQARADGLPSVLGSRIHRKARPCFDSYRALVEATSWAQVEEQSGLSRAQIEEAAGIYLSADKVITTWAMGVTQHKHSVQTIREIANFMFLRGNIGRAGAGLCPVRGHSNVQGDRTVGINEKAPAILLDALERELGVPMPRDPGHNVLHAIGAMLNGQARAFIGLGGNFARATPDSQLIAKALGNLDLTVNIATKLKPWPFAAWQAVVYPALLGPDRD